MQEVQRACLGARAHLPADCVFSRHRAPTRVGRIERQAQSRCVQCNASEDRPAPAWMAAIPALALSTCALITCPAHTLAAPLMEASQQGTSYVRIERRNVENLLVKQFKASLSDLSDEELSELFQDVIMQRRTTATDMLSKARGTAQQPPSPAAAPASRDISPARERDRQPPPDPDTTSLQATKPTQSRSGLSSLLPTFSNTPPPISQQLPPTTPPTENQQPPQQPPSLNPFTNAWNSLPSQLSPSPPPPSPPPPTLTPDLASTLTAPSSQASTPSNTSMSAPRMPFNLLDPLPPLSTTVQGDTLDTTGSTLDMMDEEALEMEEQADPTTKLLEELRKLRPNSEDTTTTTTSTSPSNATQSDTQQGWFPNPLDLLPKPSLPQLPSLPSLPAPPSLPELPQLPEGTAELVGVAGAGAQRVLQGVGDAAAGLLNDVLPLDSRTQAAVGIGAVASVVLGVALLTEDEAPAQAAASADTDASAGKSDVSKDRTPTPSTTPAVVKAVSTDVSSAAATAAAGTATVERSASKVVGVDGADSVTGSAGASGSGVDVDGGVGVRPSSPTYKRGISRQKLLDNVEEGPDAAGVAVAQTARLPLGWTPSSPSPSPAEALQPPAAMPSGGILWQRSPPLPSSSSVAAVGAPPVVAAAAGAAAWQVPRGQAGVQWPAPPGVQFSRDFAPLVTGTEDGVTVGAGGEEAAGVWQGQADRGGPSGWQGQGVVWQRAEVGGGSGTAALPVTGITDEAVNVQTAVGVPPDPWTSPRGAAASVNDGSAQAVGTQGKQQHSTNGDDGGRKEQVVNGGVVGVGYEPLPSPWDEPVTRT